MGLVVWTACTPRVESAAHTWAHQKLGISSVCYNRCECVHVCYSRCVCGGRGGVILSQNEPTRNFQYKAQFHVEGVNEYGSVIFEDFIREANEGRNSLVIMSQQVSSS